MQPYIRPRRLREHAVLRRMVRETRLSVDQLIYPVFVVEGSGVREEIPSMPGQYRYSIDRLGREMASLHEGGIGSVILFGIPESDAKDAHGTVGYTTDSIVCRSLEMLRKEVPGLLLMADVCLCEYTDHGHCGVVVGEGSDQVRIDNDPSLALLAKAALAYARAGAHVVAPSDMMDGRVGAIRRTLDSHHLENVAILSYAAKYASAFYGPFRDAAESAPRFGDRKTYQMDPANSREAMREIELDLEEGADMIMVKPAMPYLDVIARARERIDVPLAAYQVSGEYSALCAAFERGWLDRDRAIMESLLSIARAGADCILTYFAPEAATLLSKGNPRS